MEFSVGDFVVHKLNEDKGFIRNLRKAKATMAKVRWEESGITQWLPSEELRLWDKATAPAPAKVTSRGNTTPDYLVGLRKKLRQNPHRFKKENRKRAEARLAESLISLSGRRKGRTRAKAKKLITEFESHNPASAPERRAEWFANLPEDRQGN